MGECLGMGGGSGGAACCRWGCESGRKSFPARRDPEAYLCVQNTTNPVFNILMLRVKPFVNHFYGQETL